jgi:hypothetical protein
VDKLLYLISLNFLWSYSRGSVGCLSVKWCQDWYVDQWILSQKSGRYRDRDWCWGF